jgi:hypothetical protein
VIDVQQASQNPGAPLDASPQKTSGSDNQLWTFVPDPKAARQTAQRSSQEPDWRERIIAKVGLVPPAALCIHLCIGMAYGFSVFWLPLSRAIGLDKSVACPDLSLVSELFTITCDWHISSLGWMYTLFFVLLGLSAAACGGWLERAGPRKAGVVAALCWCGGLVDPIKSVALKSLARFDEATGNQTFKCFMCLVLGHVRREPYLRGIRTGSPIEHAPRRETGREFCHPRASPSIRGSPVPKGHMPLCMQPDRKLVNSLIGNPRFVRNIAPAHRSLQDFEQAPRAGAGDTTVAALSIRNGLENTGLPARGHMPRSCPVLFGKSESHQCVERSVGPEEIKLRHYGDFSLGLFAMLERDKAGRLRLGEDQIAIFGCHADLQLIRHSVICTVELCHGVRARRLPRRCWTRMCSIFGILRVLASSGGANSQ